MKAAITKQLDQAVTDKRLTADERTKILADVDSAARRHDRRQGAEAARRA